MDERSPINWVREHRGADLPRRRLAGRADRRRLRLDAVDGSRSGRDVKITRHERRPHELARARTSSGTGSRSSTSTSRGSVPDPGRVAPIAPIIYAQILGAGAPTPPLPADRFDGITDYGQARDAVRVRSARARADGERRRLVDARAARRRRSSSASRKWPPREARPTAWYFGPDGTLTRGKPRGATATSTATAPIPTRVRSRRFPATASPSRGRCCRRTTGDRYVDGTAVAYATAPLADDVTIVGPGQRRPLAALERRRHRHPGDAHRDPSRRPRDLRAERLAAREPSQARAQALDDARAAADAPRAPGCRPLPAGEFAQGARRALRGRRTSSAPARASASASRRRAATARAGRFDTPSTDGTVLNDVVADASAPSRLVLAVVPDVQAPPALPPCPGLRGQPCRTYVPAANGG